MLKVINTFICKTLGCFDNLLATLIIFIVIDYITGVMKSILNKKLSSEVGFKGILKKIVIIFMVALSTNLDIILNNAKIRYIVIIFYIVNEGISIIENAHDIGIPIPNKIKEVLENLKTSKK